MARYIVYQEIEDDSTVRVVLEGEKIPDVVKHKAVVIDDEVNLVVYRLVEFEEIDEQKRQELWDSIRAEYCQICGKRPTFCSCNKLSEYEEYSIAELDRDREDYAKCRLLEHLWCSNKEHEKLVGEEEKEVYRSNLRKIMEDNGVLGFVSEGDYLRVKWVDGRLERWSMVFYRVVICKCRNDVNFASGIRYTVAYNSSQIEKDFVSVADALLVIEALKIRWWWIGKFSCCSSFGVVCKKSPELKVADDITEVLNTRRKERSLRDTDKLEQTIANTPATVVLKRKSELAMGGVGSVVLWLHRVVCRREKEGVEMVSSVYYSFGLVIRNKVTKKATKVDRQRYTNSWFTDKGRFLKKTFISALENAESRVDVTLDSKEVEEIVSWMKPVYELVRSLNGRAFTKEDLSEMIGKFI